MADIIIDIGGEIFEAFFEDAAAPKTCARFRALLPYQDRIIHVRWSGEACWIPMGERELSIPWENATSYPAPGQIIVHPGSMSETEILVAYGPCCFASKAGQLAGNHFLTIREGLDRLAKTGRAVLWEARSPSPSARGEGPSPHNAFRLIAAGLPRSVATSKLTFWFSFRP